MVGGCRRRRVSPRTPALTVPSTSATTHRLQTSVFRRRVLAANKPAACPNETRNKFRAEAFGLAFLPKFSGLLEQKCANGHNSLTNDERSCK